MEDVEILRGLGTPPDVLERYVELRDNSIKILKKEFLLISTFLPLGLIFLILLTVGLMKYLLILMVFLYIFPTIVLASVIIYYFPISKERLERIYLNAIKEYWLIWLRSQPIEVGIEERYSYVFTGEIPLTVILWAYFTDTVIIALLSLFPLALIPIGRILSKKTKNCGYTIQRLFPGYVDEIAEKIEKALGGEKKILVKGEKYRRYEIIFSNPHNFRVYVFRRTDVKGFVEVSLAGVKLENAAAARDIISKIETLLMQK